MRVVIALFLLLLGSPPSKATEIYGVFNLPKFEEFNSLRARVPRVSVLSEMILDIYTMSNVPVGYPEITGLSDRLLLFSTKGTDLGARIHYPKERHPYTAVSIVILLFNSTGQVIDAAKYPIDHFDCSGLLKSEGVPFTISFKFRSVKNVDKFLLKYEEHIDKERGKKCITE